MYKKRHDWHVHLAILPVFEIGDYAFSSLLSTGLVELDTLQRTKLSMHFWGFPNPYPTVTTSSAGKPTVR